MPTSKPIQHFQNGILIGTTPYLEPDEVTRQNNAMIRLAQGRAQLRTIRNQAQNISDSGTVLTLVQVTNQMRLLAGAIASLAQTLMDVELLAVFNQDDGLD